MDISQAIIPKSDQLNADDLICGPMTIRISKVEVKTGEQPVSIHFENDKGKPWKPCKSMLRALVHVWGPDSSKYIGKSIVLTLDPSVVWAGKPVGGIRISQVSDIEKDQMTFALTDKKGSRRPYTVKRFDPLEDAILRLKEAAKIGIEELKLAWESLSKEEKITLKPELEKLKTTLP